MLAVWPRGDGSSRCPTSGKSFSAPMRPPSATGDAYIDLGRKDGQVRCQEAAGSQRRLVAGSVAGEGQLPGVLESDGSFPAMNPTGRPSRRDWAGGHGRVAPMIASELTPSSIEMSWHDLPWHLVESSEPVHAKSLSLITKRKIKPMASVGARCEADDLAAYGAIR